MRAAFSSQKAVSKDLIVFCLNPEASDTVPQGVLSPLVGQMFFRATLFSAFGASKRWLAQNADGSPRDLTVTDYYAAGAMTGFAAAFVEGPIDFYKSQVQVQIIRSRADPKYKRAPLPLCPFTNWIRRR